MNVYIGRVASNRTHWVAEVAVVAEAIGVFVQSLKLGSSACSLTVKVYAFADGEVLVSRTNDGAESYCCNDFEKNQHNFLIFEQCILTFGTSCSVESWADRLLALKDLASTTTKDILRNCGTLRVTKQNELRVRALLGIALHLGLTTGLAFAGRFAPFVFAPRSTSRRVLDALECAVIFADA